MLKIKNISFLLIFSVLPLFSYGINTLEYNTFVQKDTILNSQADTILKNKLGAKDTNKVEIPVYFHSFHVDSIVLSNKIISWRLDDITTQIEYQKVDTLPFDFEQFYPNLKNHISNTWLGYSGSASISNNYFERSMSDRYLFSIPFRDYLHRPANTNYYNVKRPFTLLGYTTGGEKKLAEQTLFVLHTQNVNENLNLGFKYDLISYKGIYDFLKNDPQMVNSKFTAFTSYIKENYAVHGSINVNNIASKEFGGIENDEDIELTRSNPENIGGRLDNSHSILKETTFFLNQRYRLMHSRKVIKRDSIEVLEKIPYLEFGHKLSYQRSSRLYTLDEITDDFYLNTYIYPDFTSDSSFFGQFKNSFSVSYPGLENKNFKAKAMGIYNNYVEHYYKFDPNYYLNTKRGENFISHSLSGLIEAQHKNGLLLNGKAEYIVGGPFSGDFIIDAKAEIKFKLFGRKDNKLFGNLSFQNAHPSYFVNNYYSNHYKWSNNFQPERKTVTMGGIYLSKFGTIVEVSNGLHYNYIYFNTEALPEQASIALNVFKVRLNQHVGYNGFNLKGIVDYQTVSNTSLLSLPALSFFGKIYYEKDHYIKSTGGQIYFQLGLEAQYDTEYYAMAYNPATGMFYQQRDKLLGNYPWVDVYANLRIKQMRILFKYEHLTQYMVPANYFSALHYPRNPRIFKLGISWSFYN